MARIALLYSDTGGGHRTAAEAIAQALQELRGDAHTVILANGVDWLPVPFNRGDRTYAAAMRHAPILHRINYRLSDSALVRKVSGRLGMALDGRRATDFVRGLDADVIVSCQPHFNAFAPRALRRIGPRAAGRTRYVHVITDLQHLHAFHFALHADLLIAPTGEARIEVMRQGVPPQRVTVAGYPIFPDFAERLKGGPAARAALDLDAARPTVLLMGGGEGMGDLRAVVGALDAARLPIQLVVVCGRNDTLRLELEALATHTTLRALGFVDNVPELMGASDIIITKAGTGTLCEALAAGAPIILYDAVPGQEDGNRDYVLARDAVAWCPGGERVAAQVRAWLDDPAARGRAAAAAAAEARPDAAMDIARSVLALIDG